MGDEGGIGVGKDGEDDEGEEEGEEEEEEDSRPGTNSLKITSREKWYLPLRSRTRQPSQFSSYPTNIASKRRGPPLERSSSGMKTKH